MTSHRTENKRSAPSRAQRVAQKGDLFYQTVRPYQKNNYLFDKYENNYVFSTGYAQLRPKVSGVFLLGLVQSDSFVKTVLNSCTGTSYPAINSNDLSLIEVRSPRIYEEQEKIGSFLAHLESLLTLHQRQRNGGYLWLENSAKQVCFAIITASGYRSTKKALSDQLR